MEIVDAQKFLQQNHRACIAVRQKDGWPQMTFVSPGIDPQGRVIITSRGTMDKLDSTLRELLSTRAELLGAIRLPNDAFKRNAGTEVTTDIVMLRKLRPGESPSGQAWKQTADYTNDLG